MLTLSYNKSSRQALLFIIKYYGHGSFNPQPKKKKLFFIYFIMVICSFCQNIFLQLNF